MQREQDPAITKARKDIVAPTQAGTYHGVSRSVRRAWLCGYDDDLKKDFDYRKLWVESRIAELADIFACSIANYLFDQAQTACAVERAGV